MSMDNEFEKSWNGDQTPAAAKPEHAALVAKTESEKAAERDEFTKAWAGDAAAPEGAAQ